jgi:ribokinase
MADLVIRAPRRPNRGETIVGDSLHTYLGGKGFNQALAAARSKVPTAMVGALGDDEYGLLFRGALAIDDIDASGVLTVPDVGTGIAVPLVEDDGDNSIVIIPRANHALSPAHVHAAAAIIQRASVVLLQLELPMDTVVAAAAIAHRAGATVVLNPAPAHADLSGLKGLVDIIVPNETETALLTGAPVSDESAARAADVLCQSLGASRAVITLGDKGAVAFEGGRADWHEPYVVDCVDSVGAGDAFCGALAARLSTGATLGEAVRYANAAGALATTVSGAEPSMPTAERIHALVGSEKHMGADRPLEERSMSRRKEHATRQES